MCVAVGAVAVVVLAVLVVLVLALVLVLIVAVVCGVDFVLKLAWHRRSGVLRVQGPSRVVYRLV